MTDGLRAKFTLQLDDRLTDAARKALGGFGQAVDDVTKKAGSGRDAMGRFIGRGGGNGLGGVGPAAEEARQEISGLAGALRKFNADMEAGHQRVWAFNEASGAMREASEGLKSVSSAAAGLVLEPEKAARGFEQAFTDIAVKADKLADGDIEKLRAKTMQLAEEFGILPEKVAAGVDVLSAAGWSTQLVEGENLRQMLVGSKLAFSDFDKTAAVTTGVLGAYGNQAGSVGDVVMMLANAVNASKIGMDDLAYSLTDNMAVAKDAGLAFKDLLTMQALLGQANIKGGVANTATKNLAGMLVNPGSEAQKQLDKLFGGYRKGKAVLFDKNENLKSIPEILTAIQKEMDRKKLGGRQRAQILEALFGRDVRGYAGSIMQALTQVGDDGVSSWQAMERTITETSSAEQRLAKLQSTSQAATERADAAWQNLKITLGEVALDVTKDLAESMQGAVTWVREFATEHPTVVKAVVGIAAGVAVLTGVFAGLLGVGASVLTMWASYQVASIALSGAMNIARLGILGASKAMLMSPIGIITAIATGAYLIYEYWEPISGFFSGLWDSITGAMRGALDWIIGKIEWASDKIVAMKEALTGNLVVDERKAASQRAQLAGMSDEQAAALRGLSGPVGEAAARLRDEARRDGAVALAQSAGQVRELAAASGAGGGPMTGGAPGSGTIKVEVSDDRVRVTTRDDGRMPVGLKLARGGAA